MNANKLAMKKIRRKLTRTIDLSIVTCGDPVLLQKAVDSRFELEDLIERELQQAYQDGRNSL